MSDDVFDGKLLADKLSKLNSSQQCIESSSRLCMSHRKKAKEIVDIWHKSFKSAQLDQHVSFLYLANDILQNSRRKGTEFVNEFWKVMPSALKHVNEHGNEIGKKAASRLTSPKYLIPPHPNNRVFHEHTGHMYSLWKEWAFTSHEPSSIEVGIWDERRVFGSRGQNLKAGMLGKSPLPQTPSNGKISSNPIKIVKRDANSLRLKLAVGGTPEKIITAFHSVHDENATEDSAINNCEGAVRLVGDLERDIESQGIAPGSSLLDEIQEQETVLQECVNQLETAERTRRSLISQLKEALQDQELKLNVIHTQLQVARNHIDHAANLRKKLGLPSLPGEVKSVENVPSNQSVSFGTATHVTEEENTKAAAAAVAAKLAASASSAQMLTSVLSSLVAEEAASISNSFNSSAFTSGLSIFPPEKRPKLETPMSASDLTNSDAVSSGYFTNNQTSYPQLSIGSTSSPANQFVQSSSGLMMGGLPYAYGAGSLPPPPPLPLPSHIAMSMMRPTHQPLQQPQQQQQSQPQQTGNGRYYRPPGIGFYGQNHQPTPPPVPRQ